MNALALTFRRQLQAVGVDLSFEVVPLGQTFDQARRPATSTPFLVDARQRPDSVPPVLCSGTRVARSTADGFSSRDVDAALDRDPPRASDDEHTEAGVAAFQRAIVDDPPAIFLAWSERARAVSTRFDVPAEPGRDITEHSAPLAAG